MENTDNDTHQVLIDLGQDKAALTPLGGSVRILAATKAMAMPWW